MLINDLELRLISVFEDIHSIPEANRTVCYIGDMNILVIKDHTPDDVVLAQLYNALNALNLKREQFNQIATEKKLYLRSNLEKYFKSH